MASDGNDRRVYVGNLPPDIRTKVIYLVFLNQLFSVRQGCSVLNVSFELLIRFFFCAQFNYCYPDIHSIGSGFTECGSPGRICSYWQPNFPAVSGSYLPGFSGCICSYWHLNFPAVSVVTCRDFLALPFLALPFLAPEGRDFPAVSVVSGRDFPAVAFLAWVI
jgi:hypothetical protein